MSREPAPDWQDQLQQNLRRAQEAMQQGVQQQVEMVHAWTAGLRSAYPDWGRERWQRVLEKKLRKRAEREAKLANASLFEGYLWVLGAVVLVIAAMSALPILWWLVFPAAGLGSRGARVIARHAGLNRTAPLALPPHQALSKSVDLSVRSSRSPDTTSGSGSTAGLARRDLPEEDPRDLRTETLAESILAELRTSPESVRDIFRKPEQTLYALRDTCKDLTRRERDLRRFLSPEDDKRLTRERDVLQRRVSSESDEVVKSRLLAALSALDSQREQRVELARSAARFEAEHTRISYTLENLYTQVVRVRSADSGSVDVAGAGLRRSLDVLSQEVNALADALEGVNAAKSDPLSIGLRTDKDHLSRVAEGPGTVSPGPAARSQREKA